MQCGLCGAGQHCGKLHEQIFFAATSEQRYLTGKWIHAGGRFRAAGFGAIASEPDLNFKKNDTRGTSTWVRENAGRSACIGPASMITLFPDAGAWRILNEEHVPDGSLSSSPDYHCACLGTSPCGQTRQFFVFFCGAGWVCRPEDMGLRSPPVCQESRVQIARATDSSVSWDHVNNGGWSVQSLHGEQGSTTRTLNQEGPRLGSSMKSAPKNSRDVLSFSQES